MTLRDRAVPFILVVYLTGLFFFALPRRVRFVNSVTWCQVNSSDSQDFIAGSVFGQLGMISRYPLKAKLGPVLFVENVAIPHFSVDEDSDMRLLGMGALDYLVERTVRVEGWYRNYGLPISWLVTIGKIQPTIRFRTWIGIRVFNILKFHVSMNMQSWGLSRIFHFHNYHFVGAEAFGLHILRRLGIDLQPSSLVQMKLANRSRESGCGLFSTKSRFIRRCLSSIGSLFIGTPNRNSGDSIDAQDKKSESLKRKRCLIYPIALCVVGYFGMLGAWLSSGRCRKWWVFGVCLLGMVSGFAVAVFGGLLILDRIVGVF